MAVFLRVDGYDFDPPEAEEVAMILELATGERSDEALVRWVKVHTRAV